MKCLPAIVTILALLQGCGAVAEKSRVDRKGQSYFTSPEHAVELLLAKDFRTLADYYDLSGSSIDRRELESGEA